MKKDALHQLIGKVAVKSRTRLSKGEVCTGACLHVNWALKPGGRSKKGLRRQMAMPVAEPVPWPTVGYFGHNFDFAEGRLSAVLVCGVLLAFKPPRCPPDSMLTDMYIVLLHRQ